MMKQCCLLAPFVRAGCRSKTFDAAADGYGRGEGCVVFVLRRSADRVASSEPLAVMHGTALSSTCSPNMQLRQHGAA